MAVQRDSIANIHYMKRLFDIVVSLAVLTIFSLPLLFLICLVRIKLGSPVFFTQMRPGRNGKVFRLVKFRTMTDARGPDGELLPDSVRLTPFGRMLRSTSLDELPELWNVLKGEMSLVGPRPLLIEYLPLYSPEQARRHDVRPGITGWAQVNGRNAISWIEKFPVLHKHTAILHHDPIDRCKFFYIFLILQRNKLI